MDEEKRLYPDDAYAQQPHDSISHQIPEVEPTSDFSAGAASYQSSYQQTTSSQWGGQAYQQTPEQLYQQPASPTYRQQPTRPVPPEQPSSATQSYHEQPTYRQPQPATQEQSTYRQQQPATQEQPTYRQPQPTPQHMSSSYAAHQTADSSKAATPYVTSQKQGGGFKSALFGLLGGALGALLISGIMYGTSFFKTPSVVSTTSNGGQTITINPNSEDITVAQAVAAKALPSVVAVYVSSDEGSGLGSGVILDTDGNILTNWHVAGDATQISVTIGGESYEATLVGGDPSSDLAVVRAQLNGAEVTPMEIGDSDALTVGEWVMTMGSPFGLDQSVSAGIVSSLARNELMQSTYGTTIYANLIQTDASINPGNSGGALVNSKGQLVGISTLFSSDTESFAGIGFAIPGNYAVEIANKIIAGEQVTHAYIGLSMQTVNAQNAEANGLSVNQGAYVAEVVEGSPAEKAGIKEGDIIIAMGDDQITSADGMILAVRSHSIGETVAVKVMRGDKEMTLDVTLGSDEELQALQRQQYEEQHQRNQQYPYGSEGGEDGYTIEDLFEDLNNHGGSYEVVE